MFCSCCCWKDLAEAPEDLAGALVARTGKPSRFHCLVQRPEAVISSCLSSPWFLSTQQLCHWLTPANQELLPLGNPG